MISSVPSVDRLSTTVWAVRERHAGRRRRVTSTDVGERVARRLGRSLLELGGNNAIIVDEFANLDLAVPAIVFGMDDRLQHRYLEAIGLAGGFVHHLCPSSEGFVQLALAGLGWGLMPALQVQGQLARLAELCPADGQHPVPEVDLLVARRQRPQTPTQAHICMSAAR